MQRIKNIKMSGVVNTLFVVLLLTIFQVNQSKAQSTKPKPWNVPPTFQQVKNSYAGDASTVKDGKTVYLTYCAPCHGNKGKGDGAAAASVNPKPADHTTDLVQKESDGSLYWKITEGRTPMPSFKTTLTDKQRWALVNFIRTLKKV